MHEILHEYAKQRNHVETNATWDGSRNFEFTVHGISDSNFAKCPTSRKSVSGYAAFLNGAPFAQKSGMQAFVTTSVTEAECVAATACAQEMLFAMRWLESMDLGVKKPVKLLVDNKGVVDIFNSWSANRRTRLTAVRTAFLQEQKELGNIEVEWMPTGDNPADLFTKNMNVATFDKHTTVFCRTDERGNT